MTRGKDDAVTRKKIQAKFEKLDTNGDGCLDLDELHDLLKKGNPTFTEAEVKKLYDSCDTNHDGRISFDEFLDYVFGGDAKADATGGPDDTETQELWNLCKETFNSYLAKGSVELDLTKFAKMCTDCHLLGAGFKKADMDMAWSKVLVASGKKGAKKLDFAGFQKLVRMVAAKRQKSNADIMKAIAEHAKGPELHGTKQDAVRFYDDKTTFTGSAQHNAAFEGVDGGAHAQEREARIHAAADSHLHAGDADEGDWGEVQRVFMSFAGADGLLEGREFKKMCEQIKGIYNGGQKMNKDRVDLCFQQGKNKMGKGNKIDFECFKLCIKKMTEYHGSSVGTLQNIIASSDGATMNATKTDAVRFHDDKSTYTGAHGDVHGRTDDRGASRHEGHISAEKAMEEGDDSETDWDVTLAIYLKFDKDGNGMDTRELKKFCEDCGLLDKKLTPQMLDLDFTKVAKKERKLTQDHFKKICRVMASTKGITTGEIQALIENGPGKDGPIMHATKADEVRFHDDPSTYTGMHVGK